MTYRPLQDRYDGIWTQLTGGTGRGYVEDMNNTPQREGTMSAIQCRVCEKAIRGNAAREDYNPTTQENTYLCRKCERLAHGGRKSA